MVTMRSQDPPEEPNLDILRQMIGYDKFFMNHVYKLDEIVFHEIVLERCTASQAEL